MENFVLYDEIGSGNRRAVYKGRRKETIDYVAIHCIDKSKRRLIQNNVRISHGLKNENIVQFLEWYETTNHLWLVTELCAGDTLQTILQQDIYLPEVTVLLFSQNIISGLHYLHHNGIIFSDLCPKKILLDASGILKLGNFSLARIEDENGMTNDFMNSLNDSLKNLGSPFYAAPEVLRGQCTSRQSDLWSLGCIIYEMFTGVPPFKAVSFENLCHQIMDIDIPYPVQGPPDCPVKASENLFMLIQGLLQKDPTHRIDWLELCLHPVWNGALSDLADAIEVDGKSFSNDSRSVSVVSHFENTQTIGSSTIKGSMMPDTLMEASVATLVNEENEDDEDSRLLDESSQSKPTKNIQSKSLNIPSERDMLISSIVSEQGVTNKEASWKEGTYKLQHGLAVMDLTEIHDEHEQDEDFEKEISSYKRARESKTPLAPVLREAARDDEISVSTNSANLMGLSQMIPHIGGPALNVIDRLYHQTDLNVAPIAENPRLLKLPVLKWESNNLNFQNFTLDKLQKKSRDELITHLKDIFSAYAQLRKASQDRTQLRHKMNILAYLNTVCKLDEFSNLILKCEHYKTLLAELKTPGNQVDIKIRTGRVMSVVASSATYISTEFNMSEIFVVMTDQIKHNFRNVQFKHTFLPVLGEFLFYAATQEENEDKLLPNWEPTGAVFTMINKCLQQTDDNITRHIAAKIIDNIATTTGRYCQKFLTNDTALGLWHLFNHPSSDLERITAASALCRIAMHSPMVAQHVCDRASFSTFQQGLFSGVQKTQQSFYTIFVLMLANPNHAKQMMQDQTFVKKVVHSLESSSTILRGKVYLLLAEMCGRSSEVMLWCCENRLLTFIEKDTRKILNAAKDRKDHKDQVEYIQECLVVIASNIVSSVPKILEGIIQILVAVRGRHHPTPTQTKQLRQNLPLLSVCLYLVTSSLFRKKVITDHNLTLIGSLLEQTRQVTLNEINLSSNTLKQLKDNFTSDMFSIVEAIVQQTSILFEKYECISTSILPELALFTKMEDGNLKLFSLKLFADICMFYLTRKTQDSEHESDDQFVYSVVEEYIINDVEVVLSEPHPAPVYALKLLETCTNSHPYVVKTLLEREIIKSFVKLLHSFEGAISEAVLQNTIVIVNKVISRKDWKIKSLIEQGLMQYFSIALSDTVNTLESDSVQGTTSLVLLLDAIHQALRNIEGVVKSVLSNKINTSITREDVEKLLRDCKIISEFDGQLMELLNHPDSSVVELATRSLYLSVELFGGEATGKFAVENLEHLYDALQNSPKKLFKHLLRIMKRILTANSSILEQFKERKKFLEYLQNTKANVRESDSDQKHIRGICNELMKLLS